MLTQQQTLSHSHHKLKKIIGLLGYITCED